MIVEVTKKEGGVWLDIRDIPPPYKAIRFIEYTETGVSDLATARIAPVWDCLLRRWR